MVKCGTLEQFLAVNDRQRTALQNETVSSLQEENPSFLLNCHQSLTKMVHLNPCSHLTSVSRITTKKRRQENYIQLCRRKMTLFTRFLRIITLPLTSPHCEPPFAPLCVDDTEDRAHSDERNVGSCVRATKWRVGALRGVKGEGWLYSSATSLSRPHCSLELPNSIQRGIEAKE